jgi:hypothetical protein
VPDATTLAYLAGVIDSDGFITINRSERSGKAYFGAVIGISGTRTQPHELAASLWGGKVYRHEPKNPRHRSQYQWSRQGDAAVVPILAVQPYLLIKKEQARIALEAQEYVVCGRGDNAYPWMLPDHDPGPVLSGLRDEMVYVLNQGRRIVGRELDGCEHNGYPRVPEAVAAR